MSQEAKKRIAENIEQHKAGNHQQAKRLNLMDCELTDLKAQVPELLEMVWVEELNLNFNKINNLTYLSNLPHLTTLGLENNKITSLTPLANLIKLKALDVSHNQITDLTPLTNLTKLTELWLANNQFTDLAPLTNLTQLEHLRLNYNRITDLAPLTNLTKLTELWLVTNQLANFNLLANLTQLQTLGIIDNQITDLAPLGNLINLKALKISQNQITDLAPLANLIQLKALDISHNRITDLAPLANLTRLTELGLGNNSITELKPLSNLIQLTVLLLNNNQISNLEHLSNLIQLKALDISHNKITDPIPFTNLKQLTTLLLNDNQITDLAPILPLLQRKSNSLPIYAKSYAPLLRQQSTPLFITTKYSLSVIGIFVNNNPLTTPPIEVVMQGKEAVLRYFERLQTEDSTFLREAKLLIVGEARVGKTSLLTKIKDVSKPLPTEEHSTRGIDITDYTFTDPQQNQYLVHIWDFGGQQIYHATHQLFLSNRSLYLLIDNSSLDDTKLPYWLQKIERLAGNDTPTLLVQNQLISRPKEIDESGLWGKFEQLRHYAKPFKFDFKCEKTEDKTALQSLKSVIAQKIANMPIVTIKIPQTWKTVREELSELEKVTACISRSELWALCKKNNIEKPDDLNDLSQLFHDLGVFLHFTNDPVLKHLVILQKEWATDAIYAVLDDRIIAETKKGRFCKNDVQRIWKDADARNLSKKPKQASAYLPNTDELLTLMCKFELCYARQDQTNEYVMPQMLPSKAPQYQEFANSYIPLRYEYGTFMPEGILHKLMVRMHHFVTNLEHAWVRGCIFYNEGSRAEVLEPYTENSLTIKAEGKNAKALLNNIMYELDKINSSYGTNGLSPQKLVPCNCANCKQLIAENKAPHFYKYENLIYRRNAGKKIVECDISFAELKVSDLIDDIMIQDYKPTTNKKVFISYSKADVDYKKKLENHLSTLKRQNLISTWSDKQLVAGEEWDEAIKKQLLQADIILLLVSSDFLATDYIWDIELKQALQRHENGQATVIPIIVRPCDWGSAPFGKLMALPTKGKPVIDYDNKQDTAWTEIAQALRHLVDIGKLPTNS